MNGERQLGGERVGMGNGMSTNDSTKHRDTKDDLAIIVHDVELQQITASRVGTPLLRHSASVSSSVRSIQF